MKRESTQEGSSKLGSGEGGAPKVTLSIRERYSEMDEEGSEKRSEASGKLQHSVSIKVPSVGEEARDAEATPASVKEARSEEPAQSVDEPLVSMTATEMEEEMEEEEEEDEGEIRNQMEGTLSSMGN